MNEEENNCRNRRNILFGILKVLSQKIDELKDGEPEHLCALADAAVKVAAAIDGRF